VGTESPPTLARAPRGTHDVLWPESARWERLVALFAGEVERAGYGLCHTPMFEDAAVFRRGIGAASDVVGKEMYEFTDRGGRQLALRPEGTAPVVRAFVQHRPPLPFKAWYVTPSFRYERPAAGRYRQHHQVGVEALGPSDAHLDVEVIALADGFYRALGLGRFTLLVNSMGDATCRPAYVELVRRYLDERRDQLCDEHRERLDANPLRALDCKKEGCRRATEGVPHFVDHLCDDCRAHWDRLRHGLEVVGVAYRVEHRLVRGFDYYTRTTFEFVSDSLESAENAIGGGGRYDGLVELLGGPPTPGIGFGIGIERVLLACDAESVFAVDAAGPDAFVIDLTGGDAALRLAGGLRRAGLRAVQAFDNRSLRAQMKVADRTGAAVALIVGEEEAAAGTVTLKPLRGGTQRTVALGEAVEAVRALREEAGR
jgi:histidyl-tRNA synthetase